MAKIFRKMAAGLGMLVLFAAMGAQQTCAQTALKTIDSRTGGRIVYGVVDGATSEAGGMAAVLRAVHGSCGERPVIGRVFRFRGTDMVGVFFVVVNHPAGDVKVAGLVVAGKDTSQQVEAALVSDQATRFGTSVNPMLKELFEAWNPGGAAGSGSASGNAPGTGGAPSAAAVAGAPAAPVPQLRMVSTADGTAMVGVPDGWTFDPRSASGMIFINGPHGEQMALGVTRMGIDPTNPRSSMVPHVQGAVIYPYRGDLMRSFTDILQAWRRGGGIGPAPIRVEEIKPIVQTPQGVQCVKANGQMDPDGRGMQTFRDLMCAGLPGQYGAYSLTLTHILVPNAVAEQESGLVQAIVDSWRINQQLQQQRVAEATQRVNQNTQALIQESQRQVERIHQIGNEVNERIKTADQIQAMRNGSFEYQEDSISKYGQGFSNYLLDQTVVQDNNMYNNGTIGHGTVWNQTAEALVKADPNRFEIVDTPNYWRGIDY